MIKKTKINTKPPAFAVGSNGNGRGEDLGTGAGIKKPRVRASRNKKKTWKQLNHDDIEEFLDRQREDERLGGIRMKADNDLFSIDTASSGPFEQAERKAAAASKIKYISQIKEEKGPLVDLDNLKCYEILKPHTQVPDPVVKRNKVRRPGEKKSKEMVQKDNERRAKKTASQVNVNSNKLNQKIMDPWSMEDSKTVLDNEWTTESVRRHNLRPRSVPKNLHKPSALPAVEIPHPGYSYNPTFKDHQDLLKKAVTIAEKAVQKEKNLIKAVKPSKSALIKSAGDVDAVKEEEESDPDIKEDPESTKNLPKKARTKQKKRHTHEEKLKFQQIKQKKLKNAQMSDVYRIKSLEKQIKKEEALQQARLKKLLEQREHHEKYGQKTLSKFKYQNLIPQPVLSEDLSGNLIGVATDKQKNLLLERFNSLQKRNILEPRVKNRLKRKLKLKKFQRSSARMEWEKSGTWNGIKVL